MISLSKCNQDINTISFFNNKKDLYFVDICGYYGNWFSNTFLLESKYNWKGICSELFPEIFETIKQHRTVKCYNYYLFSQSGLALKLNNSHLSSARNTSIGVTSYLQRLTNFTDNNTITVKTITLQDLLDKCNAPKIIHYLSLDTEKTELDILKVFDFSKYIFLYITVENNKIEPNSTELKNLLLDNGYLYKQEDNNQHNYIHETTILGTYYYKEDYTKPITIERKGKSEFSVSSSYWDKEEGTYNNGFIEWKTLGKGKIFYTHIDYGDGNIWQRDTRK